MPELLTPIIIAFLLLIGVEINHRFKPSSPLTLRPLGWDIKFNGSNLNLVGSIEIYNSHPKMEVMVPSFKVKPLLLGKNDFTETSVKTKVIPNHPDQEHRPDGYWSAYILK